MSIFSRLIGATALASACLIGAPASAAIQVFYDFASFSAAVTDLQTYQFPSSGNSFPEYTQGPVTFAGNSTFLQPDGLFPSTFLGSNGGSVTINSTTSGFGVYIGDFSGTQTIAYTSGTTTGGFLLPERPESSFIGFTNSDGPVTFSFTHTGEVDMTGFATGTARAPVGAAPEPAAWAMLILGFGLAGYALRRRRSTGATTGLAFA